MRKNVTAAILAGTMMASLLSGCGETSRNTTAEGSTSSSSENTSGKVDQIVFAFPTSKTVDMEAIQEELNKIIEPKINVSVKLEGIDMSNYDNQIGLMMSGGEQLDVMGYLGNFSSLLAKNQLMDMSPYLDKYGQGAKEALGDEFLKSTSSEGSVYALPTLNGKAAVMNIVLRSDLVNELNLPINQLTLATDFDGYCKNLDLITEIFAKIHETHPEYACIVPSESNPNTLLFDSQIPFVDSLNDYNGVLMPGEETKVTDLYESDEFKTLCEYAYKWNQAGYLLEDATTTQEAANTYIQNGRAAGYFIVGEEGQAEQITTATGVDVDSVKFVAPFLTTNSVNGIGFGISSNSKNPEASMKFLNELYTNADVVNLLDWGIEGRDYVVQDDGTVDFPDGIDANTTAYGLNMDWFFGNQFLSYIWGKGRDTTIYKRLDADNKSAQFSPAMGFSYDSTKVSTELAAIQNVKNQYLSGLQCGALDPETTIPEFVSALKSAGLDKVISEKQTQLDTWKANNK